MRLRGILFDLDGTLLDIDLSSFLGRYFAALSKTLTSLKGAAIPGDAAIRAVHVATESMMRPHAGLTNREVFDAEFARLTGIALSEHREVFEHFYAEEFPLLGDGYGPTSGAHDVVAAARAAGLKIALATNPIFPRQAVIHRMDWAGLDHASFDVVTSYEAMEACKPHGPYFLQTARALGIDPRECLMVGDDRVLDLAAADVGMRTYYVGHHPDTTADYAGDLYSLTRLLPQLLLES